MNLKTLSFTALTLAAAMMPADAYFRAGFKINKDYRQNSSGVPVFRVGDAYLYVVDGILTITASCANNGAPFLFPVNTMLGCNIGANGVMVDTLLQLPSPPGSGVDEEFFEIVGLEAATTVEPGRNDLVSLYARPTLDFPANAVTSVESVPTSVFYDLQSITGDVREYRLAGTGLANNKFYPGYSFRRQYTSRSQMEKEIVAGVYQFRFPSLGRPEYPLYLNFPVRNTVEGYVTKPIRQGFKFNNVGPYEDGFALYDVNVVNVFQWEGLTGNFVSSNDKLYLGFRAMVDPLDADSELLRNNVIINPDEGGQPVYDFPPPGSDVDDFPGTRIRLLSPVQSTYSLPPGFFESGETTVLEVTLERDPGVGLGIVSTRNFQLPIMFVAAFPGAMAKAFPKNTDPALMAKTADPDGDGISNWLEWLAGTDPTKANAPSTLSPLAFVPPSTTRSGEQNPGYWEMSISRQSNLPPAVKCIVESSIDLKTWAQIPENDPQWRVEDIRQEPRIRVISKTPGLVEKRYFRVRYTDPG